MPVPTRVDFVEERKQKRTSTDTKGLYSLWKKQKEGGREREGWYQRWLSLLKQTMTQQITLKYVWHIFSRSFAFNFMIRFTFYGHSKTNCVFLYFNSDRNKSNQQ